MRPYVPLTTSMLGGVWPRTTSAVIGTSREPGTSRTASCPLGNGSRAARPTSIARARSKKPASLIPCGLRSAAPPARGVHLVTRCGRTTRRREYRSPRDQPGVSMRPPISLLSASTAPFPPHRVPAPREPGVYARRPGRRRAAEAAGPMAIGRRRCEPVAPGRTVAWWPSWWSRSASTSARRSGRRPKHSRAPSRPYTGR